MAILKALDEWGNEEDEAKVGSYSQSSESIIAESIEAERGRTTGIVVVATFRDEYVNMKDESEEDCVQVEHEDEEDIIIALFEEDIMEANEMLPSKEEELVTVAEERTEQQEKVFDVITGQRRVRLTTEMESGIPALAKISTLIAAE